MDTRKAVIVLFLLVLVVSVDSIAVWDLDAVIESNVRALVLECIDRLT